MFIFKAISENFSLKFSGAFFYGFYNSFDFKYLNISRINSYNFPKKYQFHQRKFGNVQSFSWQFSSAQESRRLRKLWLYKQSSDFFMRSSWFVCDFTAKKTFNLSESVASSRMICLNFASRECRSRSSFTIQPLQNPATSRMEAVTLRLIEFTSRSQN